MPQGKNAFIRYHVLDRCFRDRRKRYYMNDLVVACNEELYNYDGSSVSERQVREDIRFMQREAGGGIPLETFRDGHRVYYRYSDPEFSIKELPMSQREVEMLTDTINMLSRFKGLPNHEWLDATLVHMKSTFNIDNAQQSYVYFSQNEDLQGLNYFTPLYEAIVSQHVLALQYHKFESESWERVVHPYQLRQYNNRWFLVGLAPKVKDKLPLVVIPLDRIDDYRVFAHDIYIAFDGDIDECFKEIVGVSLRFHEPCQHIVFKASAVIAPYIMTKPIHHSQNIVEKQSEYTIFSLDLIPNYEFESLMMTYSDNCEIIQPVSLKKKIASRAKNIVKNNTFE